MTVKVFWEDPYLTQLDTHIASVDGNDITVEETIFYAENGGQESDAGTIGGQVVLPKNAKKSGKEITYTLEKGHGLQPGDPVSIYIDWTRRYKLMRLHFAVEIILELVYRKFHGIEKSGAHIADNKARVDFYWSQNLSPFLPSLQHDAHAIISADHDIISAYSDEEAELRFWKIDGFAQVSCGGTHLRKTGEVGQIRLKRKNPGAKEERIEIYLCDGGND